MGALDAAKGILTDLSNMKDVWVMRYPQFKEEEQSPSTSAPPVSRRPSSMRRSMSFMDDPQNETEVLVTHSKTLKKGRFSLASVKDIDEAREGDAEDDAEGGRLLDTKADFDFSVLKLDLKMGYGSAASTQTLVSQLEKSSIANLIEARMGSTLAHMDKLRTRVEDTSSKVLVTGDLNAGKSTLVNAILRREVMPVDQQPCTTAFCEVHHATENGGKEEIHMLKTDLKDYSALDETTFERKDIKDLEDIISENEDSKQMIKVYVADPRSTAESFLNNGIADISLIDAPGLNRDSVKTTALYARQEEIDVVVFVVSAENHFTLSAKEFLEAASKEKPYVFIVVNKFEGIRDKAKCRRRVLEQIKELSPRTYKDAADLVHFVESSAVLGGEPASPAFASLESSLRSFVLLKRSKSKLHPAATFLNNLLSDVELLAVSNALLAQSELIKARDDLRNSRPKLEMMKNGKSGLEESLEQVEDDKTANADKKTTERLMEALDKVGRGELAPSVSVSMPSYPGILRIWDYVHDVRKVLLSSVDLSVKLAEDDARQLTSDGVKDIFALGDRFLPEGVERYKRVFMPEAMFARQRSNKGGKSRRGPNGAIVAGGIYGLGIGLAQTPEMLDTSVADIIDLAHIYSSYFPSDDEKEVSEKEDEGQLTVLGVASAGFGALALVGGKTLGVSTIIEGAVRISDIFSNESSRRWVAPVLGAAALGLTVYLVIELPSSVPRTVGRRIRSSLIAPDTSGATFVSVQSARVARETRKVLRMAAYEQRERFKSAMDACEKEVEGAEKCERTSEGALNMFNELQARTETVRAEVAMVGDL